MRIIFALCILFPLYSYSEAPIIVEKVKEGRGIIYIPPNKELKPGDMLYTSQQQEQKPKEIVADTGPTKKNLRERTHSLQLSYGSLNTTLDTVEVKSDTLTSLYSRNYGIFQVRGGLGVSKASNNSGTSTITNLYSLGVQANLIENKPGNDIIPFFAIDLTVIKYTQSSGANYVTANGNAIGYSAGVIWYPLGEIFGFTIGYEKTAADVDYQLNNAPSTVKFDVGGLSLGYIFSF